MAISSIDYNFTLSKKKEVNRFVYAIDKAGKSIADKPVLLGRQLTDTNEILDFISKILSSRH